MHQRNEATGMIVLERITPVITALFGGFLQQAGSQHDGNLFIKLWEETAPNWRTVHKALVQLSRRLDMPIPAKAQATIQGQLDWMSWFMRDEESSELKEIVSNCDFEGLADIETLFLLADVLNCSVSCDHIPRRSWALFRARDVMRGVIESFKAEQAA